MVNPVIVSHSSRLGEGVGELARQMLMSDNCKIAIAAGIDDPQNPIGTDAVKVMEAIESVADADHVLVMMDMGSALLSAETALELLAPRSPQKYVCVLRRWSKVHWQQRSARPRGRISTKLSLTPCMRWKPNVNNWVYRPLTLKSLAHVLRTMKKPVLCRWS